MTTDRKNDAIFRKLADRKNPGPVSIGRAAFDILSVSGRYEMLAEQYKGPIPAKEKELEKINKMVLRIDGEHNFVSGDLFCEDDRFGSEFQLGDRVDWVFSFFGRMREPEKLPDGKLRVLAICEATSTFNGKEFGATVELTLNPKKGQLKSARLSIVRLSGASHQPRWTVYRTIEATPIGTKADWFRHIRLALYVTEGVANDTVAMDAIRLLADDKHPLGLAKAMADEKLRVDVVQPDATQSKIAKILKQVPTVADYEAWFARAVPAVAAYDRSVRTENPGKVEPADWSHCIVFSSFRNDLNAEVMELNYGEAFGLGSALTRFNSRIGAIINVDRLLAQRHEAPDVAAKTDAEKAALILRFTVIHECAHLLNIPHAWERARGHPLLAGSRPDALSWSNYPTRHPYGNSVFAHYHNVKEDQVIAGNLTKEEVLVVRRKGFFRRFFNSRSGAVAKDAGFDAAEQVFIRNAPFDHIAQGGRTFLDQDIPAPRLIRHSDGELRLSIRVLTDQGPLVPDSVFGWKWFFNPPDEAGSRLEHIWIPAVVTLTRNGTPVSRSDDDEFFDFNFDCGALELILWPGARTFKLPVGQTPAAVSYNMRGLENPSFRRSRERIFNPHDLSSFVDLGLSGDRLIRQSLGVGLPWISQRALMQQTGRSHSKWQVQCVYHYKGSISNYSNAICSNIVEFRFGLPDLKQKKLQFPGPGYDTDPRVFNADSPYQLDDGISQDLFMIDHDKKIHRMINTRFDVLCD